MGGVEREALAGAGDVADRGPLQMLVGSGKIALRYRVLEARPGLVLGSVFKTDGTTFAGSYGGFDSHVLPLR